MSCQEHTKYVDLSTELLWAPEKNDENTLQNSIYDNKEPVELPKSSSFMSLVDQVKKFVLVGASGTGKSRCMRNAVSVFARRILKPENPIDFIPVYLPPDFLGLGHDIVYIIAQVVRNVNHQKIQEYLRQGLFWLFIDGLNEVTQQNYINAIRELKILKIKYPALRVVISTRKASYHNELKLPVYSLKDLSHTIIQEFVKANALSQQRSNRILQDIKSNPKLVAFLRTPLQVELVCNQDVDSRFYYTIPLLLQATVRAAVKKMRQTGLSLHEVFVNQLLGKMAQTALQRSGYVLSEAECLEMIVKFVQNWRLESSPTRMLEWLIDEHLLRKTPNDQIAFFHEEVLDYFLMQSIVSDQNQPESIINFFRNNPLLHSRYSLWEMTSTFLQDSSSLIAEILSINIALAARCYKVSLNRSHILFTKILREVDQLIASDSQNELFRGLYILMTIDESYATNKAFGLLLKVEWDRMPEYSKMLCSLLPNGTKKQIECCLKSVDPKRRFILLDYSRRFMKTEYVKDIIAFAEAADKVLAAKIAVTLGSIGTPAAIEYLTEQLKLPVGNRQIPIEEAITHLSSDKAASLLRDALKDSDIRVRRAAINQAYAVNPVLFSEEARYLIQNENDLFIRLVSVQILLRITEFTNQTCIIHDLFSRGCADQNLPVSKVINIISTLSKDALQVMVLDALCTDSPALQGLVTSKVVERFPRMAIDLFGLVDFASTDITISAKCAIVEGLLQTDSMSPDMIDMFMTPGMHRTLRESIVKNAMKLQSNIAEKVANKASQDSDEQVRLVLISILRKSEKSFSKKILFLLLNDNEVKIANSAFRALVHRGWITDADLLDIVHSKRKANIRLRAITVLCGRHYIWNPEHVCSLCLSKDKKIRLTGKNSKLIGRISE